MVDIVAEQVPGTRISSTCTTVEKRGWTRLFFVFHQIFGIIEMIFQSEVRWRCCGTLKNHKILQKFGKKWKNHYSSCLLRLFGKTVTHQEKFYFKTNWGIYASQKTSQILHYLRIFIFEVCCCVFVDSFSLSKNKQQFLPGPIRLSKIGNKIMPWNMPNTITKNIILKNVTYK